MKKLLIILLSGISVGAFAQWEKITGNGVLKKEVRDASGYTGIQVQGSMNVQVAYGNSNTILVEADENLLPYIETSVQDGNLVIKTSKRANLKSRNKITIYASLTRLKNLTLSGSGNVMGDGKFSNDGKTEVRISGSGKINMGVDAISELDIAISGSGNVRLQGSNCNNITATISGSGNIDCSDFKTNDVFAKVSGSGDIRVHALKSIDAKVSGSGNIYYKGSATNLSIKASGSGKIIKV